MVPALVIADLYIEYPSIEDVILNKVIPLSAAVVAFTDTFEGLKIYIGFKIDVVVYGFGSSSNDDT